MTLKELRKLLNENGVEYVIKKERGNIIKMNLYIQDDNGWHVSSNGVLLI